jgi:hypothetical protein
VRNRLDARYLPSRHNFALFRLFAYLRALRAKPETADVILALDRNQSNVETTLVGWWYLLTLTCFISAWLPEWPLRFALVISLLLAFLQVQVGIVVCGLVASMWNKNSPTRATSFLNMAVLTGMAAYFAVTDTSWVRFAGLQVLVLYALNAIAVLIVFLLREPIARLEASFGGTESAL